MAKSQKRSNREVRKPKVAKTKVPVALSPGENSPVKVAMHKPKGKV